MPKRPIDTEPDDVFEAVFGDAADRPFGAAGDGLLDLDALELPDEIDESLWAEADPEAGGVDADADSGAGDPAGDGELLDLDALELPDDIDEDAWAEADPEAGGVDLGDDDGGRGDGDVIDLEGLELPDEIDAAAWAAMDEEAEAEAAARSGQADAEGHRGAVFDAEAAEALRAQWMSMLDNGVVGFRLDLTDKVAVDADGLAFLAAFARELKAAGGALTLVASGQVMEVLAMCGLQTRWPVALEQAVENAGEATS